MNLLQPASRYVWQQFPSSSTVLMSEDDGICNLTHPEGGQPGLDMHIRILTSEVCHTGRKRSSFCWNKKCPGRSVFSYLLNPSVPFPYSILLHDHQVWTLKKEVPLPHSAATVQLFWVQNPTHLCIWCNGPADARIHLFVISVSQGLFLVLPGAVCVCVCVSCNSKGVTFEEAQTSKK